MSRKVTLGLLLAALSMASFDAILDRQDTGVVRMSMGDGTPIPPRP